MINILLVGIGTGLDLENNGRDQWCATAVELIAIITLAVFTVEAALKLISEGYEPKYYFADNYNKFDFTIVVLSFTFLGSPNGKAIAGLRMLRLVRLFSLIKSVPQLRVIMAGLGEGLESVIYIVMLLFLVIYLFAILGCLLFGVNDPVHFGSVPIAMVSLFQVSTLASWSSIAYVSWWGCENYKGSPYGDDNGSNVHTSMGVFEGFKCDDSVAKPFATGVYFAVYILFTSWVIMSLFIGVISMGMFEAFRKMTDENKHHLFREKVAINERLEKEIKEEIEHAAETGAPRALSLKEQIDKLFADDNDAANTQVLGKQRVKLDPEEAEARKARRETIARTVEKLRAFRDSNQFTLLVTLMILIVGLANGVETDFLLRCARLEKRSHGREDEDKFDAAQRICNEPDMVSIGIAIAAQTVFTAEMLVKVGSEWPRLQRYYTDEENGAWNMLDSFIVFVGFVEMTPLSFLVEDFPVVIFRLLRLLRVFRLAKALPRLRSIVEALISGFSAVGWMYVAQHSLESSHSTPPSPNSLLVVFLFKAPCMPFVFADAP